MGRAGKRRGRKGKEQKGAGMSHTHSEMEGKHLECSDLKAKISRVGLVQEFSFAAGISNG